MLDASHRDEIRERIMSRVIENPQTSCWIWSGPTSGNEERGAGYPRMSLSGQTVAVHLVMRTNEFGFIPGKKEIDHVCRNRLCVRPHPDHLELVTKKRNALRCEQAKRTKQEFVCEEIPL
ncbi:HNH endonuclease [Agrobacterium vitis]|uniref:HNH endonuclease signature motif containing protein n=1 Tax=Rhizobium/Agrobacterium group TaxID=227290 RepID=UPI0012E80FA1|nr:MULTISPECIES: HNH endonuclease signature motif containing protein [Rhizobium/Agrobacterium group]MCF1462834.1 HNH endonuclease [Allorhizobium ampelinum]MCF1493003.1 HNH endonuclease [Allorhizobium ampelinum]MVA44765.1 HNH endonuclease [Agrobacterium vitis]